MLTDLKDGVFSDELAVCVGKHDSDRERPTICAVCGETLGASGYYSFCLRIPGGGIKDMMIGSGCIRDRIREKKLPYGKGPSPKSTLERLISEFPQSGRWYGTFLHHCIAKPYVRNKECAERWDESILNMPGVRCIMDTIDGLRDNGWSLDAEMVLDCGRVDLLATHPESGTLVFDWKSDDSTDNRDTYVEQINRYMAELHAAGFQRISGYIIWVKNGRKEYVPFEGASDIGGVSPRQYVPSQRIKCTLTVEMNGGDKICRKTLTEYSHHRPFGDAVFFYIPPCTPRKSGYRFGSFEASPYREGEHPQWFNADDAKEGLRLNFICSKKRHRFTLTAEWREKRFPEDFDVPYLPFDTQIGMGPIQKRESVEDTSEEFLRSPDPLMQESLGEFWKSSGEQMPPVRSEGGGAVDTVQDFRLSASNRDRVTDRAVDPAEWSFTSGRIYESGGRFYGIYRRTEPRKAYTTGMVLVAEVDCSGKKTTELEWRHIYVTNGGKEYIYGLTNRKWKVYTANALADLSPEGMEIYGRMPDLDG